jgi:hypothetical protein
MNRLILCIFFPISISDHAHHRDTENIVDIPNNEDPDMGGKSVYHIHIEIYSLWEKQYVQSEAVYGFFFHVWEKRYVQSEAISCVTKWLLYLLNWEILVCIYTQKNSMESVRVRFRV